MIFYGPSGSSPDERCERGSILVTANLPFDECTEAFVSETLTRRVHILEMNGEDYRLQQSGEWEYIRDEQCCQRR